MRFFLFLVVALLFTLVLADHHESDNKNEEDDQRQNINESTPGPKIEQNTSKFFFDLYRQVALDHPSENIAFSLVSVSATIAFLSLGAKAQTHSLIIEGISFKTSEISEQEIHEGSHHLLVLTNRELQLSGGNALFISKEHKILQTFLDEAKRLYHSKAFSTDFKNIEEVKDQFNSYGEKNTHGKITELLDSVGKWEKTFNEELTEEGDFYVNENTTVKVPFMRRIGKYKVAFTDEATVVSIPCKGGAEALFILPNKGKLSEIEQNFNEDSIQKWKKSMDWRHVDLFLPKFKISGTMNLKKTLSKMGVEDIFLDNADLSSITVEADVKISMVFRRAVLSADEKGTEAADSTVAEISPISPNFVFKFERSFTFLISDKDNIVITAGRVINPQE